MAKQLRNLIKLSKYDTFFNVNLFPKNFFPRNTLGLKKFNSYVELK